MAVREDNLPRLIDPLPYQPYKAEQGAAHHVAGLMADKFIYVRDQFSVYAEAYTKAHGLAIAPPEYDHWPGRVEVVQQLRNTGNIRDDCDGHAFACVYGMTDLGFRSRVLLGWANFFDGQAWRREYHAVCETEQGWVLDNMALGEVLWWGAKHFAGFEKDRMSGYFEQGELLQWTYCKRP
jgi:hypothetical protein